MKRILFILALMFAVPALADDMVYRDGNDSVRLTEKPCLPTLLALIPIELQPKVRAAVSKVDGKDYPACWIATRSGLVILQYEDGDQGLVRISDFKRAPSI
jgi:hypothetical protein